jgi:hypothetical protein
VSTLIIIALYGWGIYKCVAIARRPTTNAKGAYSLALILIAVAVGSIATSSLMSTDRKGRSTLLDSDAAFLSQILIVCAVIALAALVLAVLGLRETRKSRAMDEAFASIPGRGMAIVTIVLSLLMLGGSLIGVLVKRLS